jgi:hypothetical protein
MIWPPAPRERDSHYPGEIHLQCPENHIPVVAIGSSSISGEDNVIPFPPRLELALRKRFPDRMIDVLNRGIGGQEAPEELSRFEPDVIAEAALGDGRRDRSIKFAGFL